MVKINKLLYFVLFYLFLSTIHSKSLTLEELREIIQQSVVSPFVNLLFIYNSDTQSGLKLEMAVSKISENKKNYFITHLIDCNTQDLHVAQKFPYCSEQFKQKLPALLFTEPYLNPQGFQEIQQHHYQGHFTEKAFFDFALPLMKAFSTSLKSFKQWRDFSEKHSKVPIILYFTDKEKLPTIYKVLTAHFRNTIAFAHALKNSSLAQSFNITDYPTMLLNGKQQIKLSKDLAEMIQKLKQHQGEQTRIIVEESMSNKEQLTAENMQKLIFELPQPILVHIPGPNWQVHPEWKKCKSNFKKMFTYYQTDNLAKQLNVKHLPAIVYFPKSLVKKNIQKTVFSSKDTFKDIYNEISGLIEDFTVPLTNELQMKKLTSIPLKEEKIVAILFHDDQISLSYRFLSNDQKYKKDIVFFRMKNPEPTIVQQFQIKKLPSLIVLANEPEKADEKKKKKNEEQSGHMNVKIAGFSGKFNSEDLSKFFNIFVSSQKMTNQNQNQNLNKVKIIQINSSIMFSEFCLKFNCYILLVDGRKSKNQSNQIYQNALQKIAGRLIQPIAILDAACHSEILGALEIQHEELPTFIYFNSKLEKFSRIIGTIEQKSLNLFISKVKVNKANFRGFNKVQFDGKKNCEQEHKRLDEYQTGSSAEPALDEDELQILKEIQEQEKRKKQQMKKIQKQYEKSDKKKRKRRQPKKEEESSDL